MLKLKLIKNTLISNWPFVGVETIGGKQFVAAIRSIPYNSEKDIAF
jgi:hypothetical protein